MGHPSSLDLIAAGPFSALFFFVSRLILTDKEDRLLFHAGKYQLIKA